jgi:hypothetical protein
MLGLNIIGRCVDRAIGWVFIPEVLNAKDEVDLLHLT